MELAHRVQSIQPSATLAVSALAKKLQAAGHNVIGFGAGEMEARAEVEGTPHMQEDHTVPDQLERQTGRSLSRGS